MESLYILIVSFIGFTMIISNTQICNFTKNQQQISGVILVLVSYYHYNNQKLF